MSITKVCAECGRVANWQIEWFANGAGSEGRMCGTEFACDTHMSRDARHHVGLGRNVVISNTAKVA